MSNNNSKHQCVNTRPINTICQSQIPIVELVTIQTVHSHSIHKGMLTNQSADWDPDMQSKEIKAQPMCGRNSLSQLH